MTLRHHRLAAGELDLDYVTDGDGPPVVLLHGFPQAWYQCQRVIDGLSAQFTVIAPDLRGVGGKPGPATGYDKHSMAADVRAVTEHVCGDTPAVVVGHDIGAFVTFAYALRCPERVDKLMLVDAPVPGTAFFDAVKVNPRVWHIAFHGARDLAEMLVTGREHTYAEYFIRTRLFDPAKITAEDIAVYAAAYSAPGALRAAFEWYRALEADVQANRAALAAQGRVRMPVSVIGVAASVAGSALDDAAAEIAEDWQCEIIEETGHWISEEQPEELVRAIRELSARSPRTARVTCAPRRRARGIGHRTGRADRDQFVGGERVR